MPKASPIQYAFNGGQLGPRLQGRADLARYQTGCNVLENFIPTSQGPALKRSGTRFVKTAKNAAQAARLISFEFSREQAYVLEFGELYMRVYRDSGAVLETAQSFTDAPTAANPVVCTDTSHPFSDGDEVYITGSAMTELNGRYFIVANAGANDYELTGENGLLRDTGTGGTAARVYQITTVYTAADVFDMQTAQSADVLYIAHPDHPPTKIERTSDTAWTATEIAFDWPAFRDENFTDTTIYASAATGTAVTLTASTDTFTDDMIGGYVKLGVLPAVKYHKWVAGQNPTLWKNPGGSSLSLNEWIQYEGNIYEWTTNGGAGGTDNTNPPVHTEPGEEELDNLNGWTFINRGFGYAKVTAVGSATSATVDVDTDGVEFPSTVVGSGNATKKWAISAWNEENQYPRAVAFYEDRLWWAGTAKDPQTMWGSRTGLYEDHEVVIEEADSGLQFTLASDKINAIEWMAGEDVLYLGTRGGEFTADAGSANEAITPSNIRVRRRSNYGSSESVQPVAVDSALIFVQRSSKRVHELTYDFETDRYVAPDLTEMSYDIANSGIVELGYQASPFRQLWCVLADGSLAALTYVRDQGVLGWSKHTVAGTSAEVESIAVIPHPDGDEDQVWLLVKRTVNGSVARHVEFLEKPFEEGDAKLDAFFVDSGLTFTSTSGAIDQMVNWWAAGEITNTIIDTPTAHGLTTGQFIKITSLPDYTALEGVVFGVTVITATQISLTIPETGSNYIEAHGAPFETNGTYDIVTKGLTGLHHLEGETVDVLGDGTVLADAVVSGGAITASDYVFKAQVGLPMPAARLQTMRFEAGAADGTAQGRRKRIHQLVIRLDQTGDGMNFGANFDVLDEWHVRDSDDMMDTPVPLYTGDTPSLDMPSGYERAGRVAVSHSLPLPCTVVAVMPQLTTESR